jgi:hypothetical protein
MAALENNEITAIECDILMGHEDDSNMTVPILSHPPIRESDLTLSHFLSLVSSIGSDGRSILQKHIKLDFKEISALAPSLNQILELHLTNPLSKTIFLNADILPGPGRREEEHIDASPFIETSLSHIRSDKVKVGSLVTVSMFQNRFSNLCFSCSRYFICSKNQDGGLNYSLSLGYKVNFLSDTGYTKDDVDRMAELVRHYKIEEKDPGKSTTLNSTQMFQCNYANDQVP